MSNTTNDKIDNENNVRDESSNSLGEINQIYTEESLNRLKDGILQIYQPKLKTVKGQLNELTMKQNLLVEQMHNENLKIAWKHNSEEYQEMFRKIQVYRNKLLTVKSDMRNLHDRSQKLVKRSTRIQHLKEKADQAKNEERIKEERLIASK